MNPYREELMKQAGLLDNILKAPALFRAAKTALTPTTAAGRFLRTGANWSVGTAGFNALSDEDMRNKYGFVDTWGRKMLDPRTYVMAAGMAVGAPVISKATLGAGRALAGLDRIGGHVPLVNILTRPLGALGRATETFLSAGSRYAANQAGGTGRYIMKGFREGGADKDMFMNTLSGLRNTKAFQNEYSGVGGTVKRLFQDTGRTYDKAAAELTRRNTAQFRWQNRKYFNQLAANPNAALDTSKLVGGVSHSFPNNEAALNTAISGLGPAERAQFESANAEYLQKLRGSPGEMENMDPSKFVGGHIVGAGTPSISGGIKIMRNPNGTVTMAHGGTPMTKKPFSEFQLHQNEQGHVAMENLSGGGQRPLIDLVNKKRGEMGVRGFATLMNPYSAIAVPSMSALTMGYGGVGPWSPQTSLYNEDAPVYKPFGSPRGQKTSQFRTY